MVKAKTVYVCSNCGADSPKWIGKCPSCGEWNTYVEEIVVKEKHTINWKKVACVVGVIAAVAGVAYAIYRYFKKDYEDEFMDDFDDWDDDEDLFEDDAEEDVEDLEEE